MSPVRSELEWSFRFAVLVAGFRSHSAPHQYLYDETIELPTLHVFGDNDQVIPRGEPDREREREVYCAKNVFNFEESILTSMTI